MVSFEGIINSLEEAIILFDKATSIIYMNKTAEELLGKNAKDVIGKKLHQIVHDEKYLSPLIKKTLAEGRSFKGRSANLNIDRVISMDFSLAPYFVSNRIEGALLSISENLSIAEKENYDFDPLDFLIGTIAHEIKNPLGGIKGAAQLLQSRPKDASPDEYTNLIIKETDRLNAILGDYLTLCKKPSFRPVNIHEVVEKALSLMNLPLKKGLISVNRSYDPSLPQVKGDESKLLQVFLNIIKNAIESMKKGGRLDVSTRLSLESVREGGRIKRWALVSIKDTGKGISEEDLQRIFIPFYTKKKRGTGIGLAVSRKIIRDHNGLIKVKSIINRGTSFLIYIPFIQNA